MTDHKPNPVFVLQHSVKLRKAFSSLREELVDTYNIKFWDFADDPKNGDDSISIGFKDEFLIVATSNGKFWLHPGVQPGYSYEEAIEAGKQAIADLEAGMSIADIVPKIPIKNFYGKYVDDCSNAIILAITWLRFPPDKLPKDYNSPVWANR